MTDTVYTQFLAAWYLDGNAVNNPVAHWFDTSPDAPQAVISNEYPVSGADGLPSRRLCRVLVESAADVSYLADQLDNTWVFEQRPMEYVLSDGDRANIERLAEIAGMPPDVFDGLTTYGAMFRIFSSVLKWDQ